MNKRKLMYLFLLINCISFAQSKDTLITYSSMFVYNDRQDTIRLTEVGEIDYTYCYINKDTCIEFRLINPSFPSLPREQINASKDSISIFPFLAVPSLFNFVYCDSLSMIDSLQIDGHGAKEVVFYRHFTAHLKHEGSTLVSKDNYELEKIEIWNIDTKTVLFEKIIGYTNHHYSNSVTSQRKISSTEEFKLEFIIDHLGVIHVIDKKGLHSIMKSIPSHLEFGDPYSPVIGVYGESENRREVCPEMKSSYYEYRNGVYQKKQ